MRAGKRTFKPPRLKSQICLIGGNGFVCSSLNELNSKLLTNRHFFVWIFTPVFDILLYIGIKTGGNK